MNAEILERKIRIVQDSLQNGALQWIYLATFNTNKKNRGETPNEKNNQQMRPRTQYAPLEKQKLIPDKPSYSIGASAHADTCDFDHFFR